jgi:energy-coupling factor transporter transmembrane protein EcfT
LKESFPYVYKFLHKNRKLIFLEITLFAICVIFLMASMYLTGIYLVDVCSIWAAKNIGIKDKNVVPYIMMVIIFSISFLVSKVLNYWMIDRKNLKYIGRLYSPGYSDGGGDWGSGYAGHGHGGDDGGSGHGGGGDGGGD